MMMVQQRSTELTVLGSTTTRTARIASARVAALMVMLFELSCTLPRKQ